MKQTKCMVCGSDRLSNFLDLGLQPNGNSFPDEVSKTKEIKYPLSMSVCESCWLVQLDDYPPPEGVFTDHPYVTGFEAPLVQHFSNFSKNVLKKIHNPPPNLLVGIW